MNGPSRALALVILLAGTTLAGCIGGTDDDGLDRQATPGDTVRPLTELTQPIYETILRSAHVIQGEVHGEQTEEIWLDVYRPDVPADTKVPVILVMTPYQALGDAFAVVDGVTAGDPPVPPEEVPYNQGLVDFYVPRGYAVAFSDVRGNHNAGGCIDQTGPGQWADGYFTVEWLAEQAWSNGKVGMYGISYDGETQVSTALLNPPSLVTIVPVASVQSQYQYLYYNGVPYNMQGVSTMGGYLAISLVPGTDPNGVTNYPDRVMCQPENFEESLDLSGDWSDYWEDRAYWKLGHQVTNTSVLHVHGLGDWNVKPDHIDPQFNAWTTEKRAIFGQWPHAYPDRGDWRDEAGILHRWYDHYLMGIDTGLLDELPPVLIEDTEDRWYGIDAFPLEDGPAKVLNLSADGTLTKGAPEPGELTLHDYPRDNAMVPFEIDPVKGTIEAAGQTLTGHPAALFFETGPLEREIVLTGRPSVTFTATTSETSTHWVAHLYAVTADSVIRLNRGYQDTRHLDGLDQPQDVSPGEAYEVTVEMFPQADVVPEGAKLVLMLTNDDDWVHQDTTYAMSTLTMGEGNVAKLVLPVMPSDALDVPEDTLVD